MKTESKAGQKERVEAKSTGANEELINLLAQKRISKIVEQTEIDYDPKVDWQDQQAKQRKSIVT